MLTEEPAAVTLGRSPRSHRTPAWQSALLGVMIALTLTLFVVQGYRVSGACMEPHLYTGQRVLAFKLAYSIHAPRRGDIVIFAYPRDVRETYVKRVIGLPGETVAIRAGQVFINGTPLPETYRVFQAHGGWGPQFIPHDQFFVMGDNRDVSDDSRYWGDLPRRDIVGRAVACYWPPKCCRLLR